MTKPVDSTRQSGQRRHVADADVVPLLATLRVSAAWGLPELLEEHGVPIAGRRWTRRDWTAHCSITATTSLRTRSSSGCSPCANDSMQCDYVGMLVGQRSRLADMGLAGEVAACADTVGAGLRAFIDHFNLHDTAATCTLIESGRYARFMYTVLEHGMADTRHFQFGGITIALNIFQDLCGPDFVPGEVNFASRVPTNARAFQKIFPRAGALRLRRIFTGVRPSLARQGRWPRWTRSDAPSSMPRSAGSTSRCSPTFPPSCAESRASSCLLGNFTMDDVAAILSMHRRTLDRHLQERGVQYGELVEAVKEDVARQLLRDTAMPIQRIAATVRFSSAANFATAFRRRVGMTPSAYRRGG